MRWWVAVALAVAAGGCERTASKYAAGSGYGVGIPRVNLMLGHARERRRWTTNLVANDREYAGPVTPAPEPAAEPEPEQQAD